MGMELDSISFMNKTDYDVYYCRRHAERTAQLWIQRLKDSSSSKRLNLIYLANEVAQQSKVRRKDDFLVAFSPIIAEATAVAYKGATNEIQQKLRRVVEVWRQRQIFEVPIQEAIETRIDDLDKSRSSNRKPLFGSSLGSSSVPPEIQPLIPLQGAVTKLPSSTKTAVDNAKQEYMKTTDPSTTLPTPPVYAARLSGLLKTLANAEGAVAEGIKARRALVEALEKLLDVNRNALSQDEAQHLELANWKAEIDQKKRDVEDSIMRGLAEEASPSSHANGSPGSDNAANRVARDSISSETERAPSVEALTPTGTPPTQTNFAPRATASDFFEENPKISPVAQQQFVPAAGSDLLSSLAMPFGRPAVGSQANGSSAKKRKLNDADDFPGLGGDDALAGLDDDVAEMLRRDSGGF
ncbi:hypothetical protein FGG08_005108 [Glutinoglossum americanum]|uniref:CID domain-containing protein n=1 Tax=Glutinoglossum americanum TaxID=1670608 RepID=A0A9P8KYU9_9PEZI|nr:hypothetical protein FGG08_005108 [Glutinoglossum americanum]